MARDINVKPQDIGLDQIFGESTRLARESDPVANTLGMLGTLPLALLKAQKEKQQRIMLANAVRTGEVPEGIDITDPKAADLMGKVIESRRQRDTESLKQKETVRHNLADEDIARSKGTGKEAPPSAKTAYTALMDAQQHLQQMQNSFNELSDLNQTGPVVGRVMGPLAHITGGKLGPKVLAYGKLTSGLRGRLRAAAGMTGRLTNVDLSLLSDLIPELSMDKDPAGMSFRQIQNALDTARQDIIAAYPELEKVQARRDMAAGGGMGGPGPVATGHGMVPVISPEGVPGKMPLSKVGEALKRGFKLAQ